MPVPYSTQCQTSFQQVDVYFASCLPDWVPYSCKGVETLDLFSTALSDPAFQGNIQKIKMSRKMTKINKKREEFKQLKIC